MPDWKVAYEPYAVLLDAMANAGAGVVFVGKTEVAVVRPAGAS